MNPFCLLTITPSNPFKDYQKKLRTQWQPVKFVTIWPVEKIIVFLQTIAEGIVMMQGPTKLVKEQEENSNNINR